ncbi:metal-dependent hydrolase [Bacterioplanoides sp.]|uniref:metal-dependent hydrolase n=1 Tax=Bacterioplanoides sp. TaxID=2066072 RepID=UPI003B5AA46F
MSGNDTQDKRQVEIKARRMAFDLDEPMREYAIENNSLISTFFYALSAMFPEGERFFIHSVRHYRDQVKDPVLKEQIRGFIGQEAHHGHSHEGLNDKLVGMGFPVDKIVAVMDSRVKFLKKFSPERQLAVTVAMEHFTATLAEQILENPEYYANIDPTLRKMLIWHAVEEIEHKAVAFDVYRQFVNNEFMRKRVMVLAVGSLLFRLAKYQRMLLKAKKHRPSWKEWKQAFHFFWNKEHGMMRHTLKALLPFFKTGFHPWDIDQFELIDGWQERFPDVAELQM